MADVSSVGNQGDIVAASSGNVANASAVATIAAVAGKTNYIDGFDVTGAGATAGGVGAVTVTGLAAGTLTYNLVVPTGATTSIIPLQVRFNKPLPASAAGVAIVVTAGAFGAGNTSSATVSYGFRV